MVDAAEAAQSFAESFRRRGFNLCKMAEPTVAPGRDELLRQLRHVGDIAARDPPVDRRQRTAEGVDAVRREADAIGGERLLLDDGMYGENCVVGEQQPLFLQAPPGRAGEPRRRRGESGRVAESRLIASLNLAIDRAQNVEAGRRLRSESDVDESRREPMRGAKLSARLEPQVAHAAAFEAEADHPVQRRFVGDGKASGFGRDVIVEVTAKDAVRGKNAVVGGRGGERARRNEPLASGQIGPPDRGSTRRSVEGRQGFRRLAARGLSRRR